MSESESASSRAPDALYGSAADDEARRRAFLRGDVPVAVYGLGKMGLPLAAVFAETGGRVVGADIDPAVVEEIRAGRSHVTGEPGLDELVADQVERGSLTATTDPREAATEASVHVVIVPTPITDRTEPDLATLDAVVADIGAGLAAGDLVIVESTVPPGTTAGRVRPALEEASGLALGEFGLAFCPERTASGRALRDIRGAYPKVVGGCDDESARAARLVYEELNDSGVVPVADATTAEAVKVFEGVYRDVNIALANELATLADELDVDVADAIEVANTQPYCDLHEPGPGVGGHCIPYYPYFLIHPCETATPLLETAREVNDAMPAFTVERLREGLARDGKSLEGAAVALLGLTYRPGVEELRASPAIAIAERLSDRGAEIYGVDPLVDEVPGVDLEPLALEALAEEPLDAVVLVTPHEEFESIPWAALERSSDDLSVVVDGRRTLDETPLETRRYAIGRGFEP